MLSICFLLGEVNDFTVAGVAVKLQSMTLELGSIEGMTLICCARCPFPFPLNAGLELGQFRQKPLQDNIGREKDRYQSSETQVEGP